MTASTEIWRLITLEAEIGQWPWVEAGMARVLQQSAARWPAEPRAQADFQDLWLDSYLQNDRHRVYVALDGAPVCQPVDVVGYLVASDADQATSPRFRSLDYFTDFAASFTAFPVHLHINVDPACRGQGLGRLLIAALIADLKVEGVPGVHIVTAAAARNVGFYQTAGFHLAAQTNWRGRDLVLMGQRLR